MKRRSFLKHAIVSGSGATIYPYLSAFYSVPDTWYDRPMRWAQLVLVENDPGNYDPDFWLDYFKKIKADAACLSGGGVVAYYPTEVPYHHRSKWLDGEDAFGYLVEGCRRMGMSVIARTDPHACWDDVYNDHPDWVQTEKDGNLRKHWSNEELWVTCALGPYNFDFMDKVHREIMDRFEIDGIFSNRWAGHGVCYCKHCQSNFREYAGMDLPENTERLDPVYQKWTEWRIERLRELWVLWDSTIQDVKSNSRFIPNGFPDRIVTGEKSDIFFTDHQARRGLTAPWDNGKRAKELRATMGMKPLGGIFSVGIEEEYRWKDSVQTEAEIRIWASECIAHNMRLWFVKFGGVIYDERWLPVVQDIYEFAAKHEKYLRNKAPIADIGVVYSEQTSRRYGGEAWQHHYGDHGEGMYHALVEARIPFEMVNDRLLDAEHLNNFKLLVLPNIAALSDHQCQQIQDFVDRGGSVVATFETSLYDEHGDKREDFGLKSVFQVSTNGTVEGPMKNSYLQLKADDSGAYHPILEGLEHANRIINGIYRLETSPLSDFPEPVTLIPSYPDLPMEHVYPRTGETHQREVYLRGQGNSRIAFIPWDIDRTFWDILASDHGRLLANIVRWAAKDELPVRVEGPGVVDVSSWLQEDSMTVHLVNLTNPMMLKGPYRELIPLSTQKVSIQMPDGKELRSVKLLKVNKTVELEVKDGIVHLEVPTVLDHEIIAIDFV